MYKAKVIERLPFAEGNIQNVSESVGRAHERLDCMLTRPETPDITEALAQLEKRITDMNQQVEAVQAKANQALDKEEQIRERLGNILTTGEHPVFSKDLSEVNNHLTQMNQRLDMADAILNEKLDMLGRMLGDSAPQIGNNAADDKLDAQEPVGNVTQDVAAASSSWRRAGGDQRFIHASFGKCDICSRQSSLTYCVQCNKKVCRDDKCMVRFQNVCQQVLL